MKKIPGSGGKLHEKRLQPEGMEEEEEEKAPFPNLVCHH